MAAGCERRSVIAPSCLPIGLLGVELSDLAPALLVAGVRLCRKALRALNVLVHLPMRPLRVLVRKLCVYRSTVLRHRAALTRP